MVRGDARTVKDKALLQGSWEFVKGITKMEDFGFNFTIVLILTIIFILVGFGVIDEVVEDSVFEKYDRVAIAFFVGSAIHVPFYLFMLLHYEYPSIWWSIPSFGLFWGMGILLIKLTIRIPFTLIQSIKLFFLLLWSFWGKVFFLRYFVGRWLTQTKRTLYERWLYVSSDLLESRHRHVNHCSTISWSAWTHRFRHRNGKEPDPLLLTTHLHHASSDEGSSGHTRSCS